MTTFDEYAKYMGGLTERGALPLYIVSSNGVTIRKRSKWPHT